ncbi:hypothetical protein I3842_10G042400 [Carya illinoinensis]|uniref:Cytochrome P450 n=2 Tax=Carya illinoinensis TaxID=32201 RepID=A0A922DUB9_CARIL|nr:hypothetical protein I3842_10G042400 [Carya illinoinensis]
MDQFFSVQSFLIFFFLLSIYIYLISNTSKKKPIHKGFNVYLILGTLPELLQNRHRFLDWTTKTLDKCPTNTSVFRRPGKIQGVITSNPSNVEHMLKTNFENYPKGDCIITLLGDFLGRGIFNSDGELWMENVTVETMTRLVPILSKAAETASVLNFQDILERFAFDNVCKLAFNVDPGCLGGDGTVGAKFMRAFGDAATLSSGRFLYAIPILGKLKKFLNIGSERRLRDAIRTVHEFADDIIRSRLEQKVDKDADLLSRFIANEANSPEFLRDIVISFILAGRDTTSSTLSWFIWLLSSKPDVERNILKELGKIRAHGGKNCGDSYTFDELRDMQYLHAAIKEAMRLYPPVPIDTKVCLNDDIMPDGTFVKKGWIVAYHTYAMGRMEGIWEKNCREFLPERWLENGVCRQVSPYKFLVFHAGPRICLGKELAYTQMKSIAASMIERFEIEVVNKDKGVAGGDKNSEQ